MSLSGWNDTAAASWAFAQLGITRLEIVITASGIHGLATRRVAEKAGFVYKGIRRSPIPATGRDYADPRDVLPAPAGPEATG